MKKTMFLMLALLSNLILSQNTNTKNIEIPASQIPEIYKGLKQTEYLKVRLQKTESALKSANDLISEQEKAIETSKSIISGKDEILSTTQEVFKQEKNASIARENQLRLDINILQNDIKINQLEAEKRQRKRFWNGIKIGGFSVAVLGAAGLIWMNQRK